MDSIGNCPIPTTPVETFEESREFTDYEIDAAIYFFKRLRDVYLSKFDGQFKNEQQLESARREWAKRIGKYSREQLDHALEVMTNEYERGNRKFEWPNIGLTLGIIGKNWERQAHKIHQPERRLEDKTAKERARKAGAEALKTMRELTDDI